MAMRTFATERRIAAPAEAIWAILTDAERLVRAGTGIERLDGDIEPGARLHLKPESSSRSFALRVDRFEPPLRMTWTGGLPLGLFRGVRRFELQPHEDGTHFRMEERFSGPLAKLFARSMPDLQPDFDRFAAALAAEAEA